MFSAPSVVLVDNEKSELDQLRDAFFSAGLPCLPFHFISDDPQNSGLDHVTIPDGLRIRFLFLDLNLMNSQSLKPVELVGPVAKVIDKLAPSGPYILIYWSQHIDGPKDVMKLLESRFVGKIALPLAWGAMAKTEFQPADDEDVRKRLPEKIKEILNAQPFFNALFSWEAQIADAARDTLSRLHKLAHPLVEAGKDYSIEEHQNNLKRLFVSIAHETVGTKNVKDAPGAAVEMGLIPVLADRLTAFRKQKQIDDLWMKGIPELSNHVTLEGKYISTLNSFYHIESVNKTFPKTARGVFVGIDSNILETPEIKSKFEKHIGRSIDKILTEEFLYDGFKPKAELLLARKAIKLGFVEISAECDHAQKKIKLHKYLLCALIPGAYEKQTFFVDGNGIERDRSHDGIYRLPQVNIAGDDFVVMLSFKYQIGSHKNCAWFGDPVFRIKEQILSEISFKCAQYLSRPGITCFRKQ